MIVLWDLDDTIFDWSARFRTGVKAHPAIAALADIAPSTFDRFAGIESEEHRRLVQAVLDAKGYYEDLEPLPGALEAVQATYDRYGKVFLVSTPWTPNPLSMAEKRASVEKWLGIEWVDRMILTHDKTVIHGDVLIDDRDTIRGLRAHPDWTRIWVDQPWNQPPLGAVPESLGFRLKAPYDAEKVLRMLQWIEHVRVPWHSPPFALGNVCDACRKYWSDTR